VKSRQGPLQDSSEGSPSRRLVWDPPEDSLGARQRGQASLTMKAKGWAGKYKMLGAVTPGGHRSL